jgi:DNA-binding GntR family transcriptional regulator
VSRAATLSADARSAPAEPDQTSGGAVDRTVRVLRDGIETGAYAPGQRLIEPDLTRELGVSRSSLREAFRRLSAEGVIEVVPNRGASVRRLSVDDIREVQQIRSVLEPLAASLAAEAIGGRGNRVRFDEAARVWLSKPPLHDVDEFSRENRRFHRTIVELSGNRQLATIIDRLNMFLFAAHFRQRITLDRRIAAAGQHREIAIAIRAGDGRAAQKAMKGHIGHSDKIVLPGEADELGAAAAR